MVLAGRDLARLGELHTALGADGVEAAVARVDVTDDAAVASVVAAIELGWTSRSTTSPTHPPTPLAELDLADFDRVLAVSLRGVAVAMKFESRRPPRRGCDRERRLVGRAGRGAGHVWLRGREARRHRADPGTAALDYASRGIRVNAVAPGPIESGSDERTGSSPNPDRPVRAPREDGYRS